MRRCRTFAWFFSALFWRALRGLRQFARGNRYIGVTSPCQTPRMAEVQTSRVHRTWLDRMQFWGRAYETKIFDERREVLGRGPTPEASREAAERRWLADSPQNMSDVGVIAAPTG